MSNTIHHFIQSSISLAFLTIISFATAYCYGWGQAVAYGYPWWHVEIGNASMARSLAYVFVTSLLLFLCYLLGYAFLNKISKNQYFQQIGWLRVIVLVSVFTIPVLLTFYLFIGTIPIYLAIIYILISSFCVWMFHQKWNNISFKMDFRMMLKQQHFWIFNLFIFVYFSILALSIGYLRADLRVTYDYMQLNDKYYYILSTNSENSYIMAEKTKDNDEFVFFNRENQNYYIIHVVKKQ